MAGSKEATDRPSYHAVGKEDIVAVDRKTFRSNVHVGTFWVAQESDWVLLGCMQHPLPSCCQTGKEVPINSSLHCTCRKGFFLSQKYTPEETMEDSARTTGEMHIPYILYASI